MGNNEDNNVDPELLEIYIEEATDILDVLTQSLATWEKNFDNHDPLEELQRELHTLKGGARMIKQPKISTIAHELEQLYENISQKNIPATKDVFKLATKVHDIIYNMIECLKSNKEHPSTKNLLEELKRYNIKSQSEERQEEQENQLDNDLISIYISKTIEILDEINDDLSAWKEAPKKTTYSVSLQRKLHTLKGGARMVNQMEMSSIAHGMEYLLEANINKSIPSDAKFFSLITEAYNFLCNIIENFRNKKPIPKSKDFLDKLRTLQSDLLKTTSSSTTATTKIRQKEKEESVIPTDELIRLRASIIDNLSNLSGENSITNVHLTNKIIQMYKTFTHIHDTSIKLLNQVTKLEKIIPLRAIKEQTIKDQDNKEFDVLEMDKYTETHAISRLITNTANNILELCNKIVNTNETTTDLLRHQARLCDYIQNNLLRTKMVSFDKIAPRLRRIINQLSSELNKDVDFNLQYTEGEIDKTIIDKTVPALEHILRNALDHGVESKQARITANKPPIARISLSLSRIDNDVSIEITDDGAGINVDKLKEKAIKMSLINDSDKISYEDTLRLILLPGFSTKEKVTQISGRGIGMDVVNTNIKQLGGSLAISSQLNIGTTFLIKLPFTSSLNHGPIV